MAAEIDVPIRKGFSRDPEVSTTSNNDCGDMTRGISSPSPRRRVEVWAATTTKRIWASDRLARASSTGLLLVLIGVSGFAMWSAMSTRRSAERAIASSTLLNHYAAAAAAVAAQESLERKYRFEPGPQVRSRFQKASAELAAAMALVRKP